MPSPKSPIFKTLLQLLVLGALGSAVLLVLALLLFLLLTLEQPAATPSSTLTPSPVLALPTAAILPDTGPAAPRQELFVAIQPLTGFSDCDQYGFTGQLTANKALLPGVQVAVWEARAGLIGLARADSQGQYRLLVDSEPAYRKLWVQIYQNDVPASQAVAVETHIDCDNGFQIYEINWQQLAVE